jgi:hypothetical protein
LRGARRGCGSKIIRTGVERALSYGIDREADVARYISIMYTLGHDFDADPRYRWAAEILNDEIGGKMDRVCEMTKTVLSAMERSAGGKPSNE